MTITMTTIAESDAIFARIGQEQAAESYVPEWHMKTPAEEREENGLGIALAHYADWDGVKLMRIFMAALEDANFHGEAERVEGWIRQYYETAY